MTTLRCACGAPAPRLRTRPCITLWWWQSSGWARGRACRAGVRLTYGVLWVYGGANLPDNKHLQFGGGGGHGRLRELRRALAGGAGWTPALPEACCTLRTRRDAARLRSEGRASRAPRTSRGAPSRLATASATGTPPRGSARTSGGARAAAPPPAPASSAAAAAASAAARRAASSSPRRAPASRRSAKYMGPRCRAGAAARRRSARSGRSAGAGAGRGAGGRGRAGASTRGPGAAAGRDAGRMIGFSGACHELW